MMSGALPDRDHPSLLCWGPYQIINDTPEKSAGVREKCDKVFATFGGLRGRIIEGTIAMEAVLDNILVSYYSPTISADVEGRRVTFFGPEAYRQTEFYDVILSNFGLARKIDVLCKTLSLAGVPEPLGLRKALAGMNNTRNEFAHGIIGIDAQTGGCFLWSSKKRMWKPVAAGAESKHRSRYVKAMELLSYVRYEIERMLASGKQYPLRKF